jgi:hypothetical protein
VAFNRWQGLDETARRFDSSDTVNGKRYAVTRT